MARVIFLTDFSEAYARELLLGMARYAHDTAQAWSLCRLPLSIRDKFGIEAVVEWAVRMKADAVIGQFYNTDNVGLFRENGIIAIAQDFKKRFTTIPNITGPHHLAGRMAAEYFLKKGFRNFAFYGTRGIDFSDERCQGFRETVEQANPDFTFSSLRSGAQNDLWYYDTAQLITWLQSLPKPVAIMACDDNQAYHITEACLQIEGGGNSRIPNDIAILGVDNDLQALRPEPFVAQPGRRAGRLRRGTADRPADPQPRSGMGRRHGDAAQHHHPAVDGHLCQQRPAHRRGIALHP